MVWRTSLHIIGLLLVGLLLTSSTPLPGSGFIFAYQRYPDANHLRLMAAHSEHAHAQYQQALVSSASIRAEWLEKARRNGSAEAYFLFASEAPPDKQEKRMRTAMRLGSADAARWLKQHWWKQGQWQLLNQHKSLLAFDDDEALQLQLHLGDHPSYSELAAFTELTHGLRKRYLDAVTPYSDNTQLCTLSVEVYSRDWAGLTHIEKLVGQWQSDASLAQLPLCFMPPKLLSTPDCNDEQRLYCKDLPKGPGRYALLLGGKGKANVNGRWVYVPDEVSSEVLIHELFHLLGFADEYKLSARFSQARCHSRLNGDKLNLMLMERQASPRQAALLRARLPWKDFIKADTPLVHKVDDKWVWGTPASHAQEVGLFPAKACHNSFKPLQALSNMEYHELTVPELYLKLAKQQGEAYALRTL